MNIIKSADRGTTDAGWLQSHHSFSFGDYHDPNRMGFRSLRVINDDIIAPGQGFPTHGHRDMEIISVVLAGALEHKDSLGTGEVLRPGEVQVMTAGRGIKHSEFNPSSKEPTHLLQVWIMPKAGGLAPAYGQRTYPVAGRKDRLVRVAGQVAATDDGALVINQDAHLYVSTLTPTGSVSHTIAPGRAAYVHVATGNVNVNGTKLSAGDAATIETPGAVTVAGDGGGGEVLLFDLK